MLNAPTHTGELEGILEIKCRYPRNEKAAETIVPFQTMTQIFYYMPQVQALDCVYIMDDFVATDSGIYGNSRL